MDWKTRLGNLPGKSGVYLLKDSLGEVLYVGKARSLRNRVRSYFQKGAVAPRIKMLQDQVADFEVFVTQNEVEAFILESNLIKKYQPKFNIRLKDDKTYPYIKVDLKDPFPSVQKTRMVKKDGARYFGPYTSVDAVNRTLKIILRLFPLRTCKRDLQEEKTYKRPCLNYHIKRCLGPCVGSVTEEEYRELMEQVLLFLEGRQDHLIKKVEQSMHRAAEEQEYEKAAEYRDALQAMEKVRERQEVVWEGEEDHDILGLAIAEDRACIQVFQVRHGRLLGREYFFLQGVEDQGEGEVITAFLQQYYAGGLQIPREILLPVLPHESDLLAQWLRQEGGRSVGLQVPQRGKKFRMVEMARENAQHQLKQEEIRQEELKKRGEKDLKALQNYLNIEDVPHRIEGFDISNLQGGEAVGSMVVFEHGQPRGEQYRRFKIKTVEGSNDVAMLQEVLERRLQRMQEQPPPQLILIDGGKGQVNGVYAVLKAKGYDHIPILGLAKKEELLFRPHDTSPLRLDLRNPGLQLLQRVRDEAHRFALGYHRQLRLRSMTHSLLEEIPGIGPQKRQALLEHFGSLAALRQASVGQLCEVPGINSKTAGTIRDFLQESLGN